MTRAEQAANRAYPPKIDEVDTTQKAIVFSPVNFENYTNGGHYVYAVQ